MATPEGSDNLRDKTISGVSWGLLGGMVGRALSFAVGIVLARLLLPSDFGLISMIFVFVGFANIFCHLGFPAALIYTKEVDDGHYSSVFWTTLISSTLVLLVFWVAAPWIAAFYDNERLTTLTRVFSLGFLIEGLRTVPLAKLTKDMRFRFLISMRLINAAVVGVLTIGLVVWGAGVWALVFQQLCTPLLELICAQVAIHWLPRFTWQWAKIRSLLRISLNGIGSVITKHWGHNFDNLLIGRTLGSSQLGIYARSYSLMNLFHAFTVGGFIDVLSPLMTELREDRPRAGRYFLQGLGIMMMLTMFSLLLLAVGSEHFVLGLYGMKWEPLVPVLRIMCLVGIVNTILPFQSLVMLTQDRPGATFLVELGHLFCKIAAVLICFRWGLTGIAWGLLVAGIVVTVPALIHAMRLLQMPLHRPLVLIGQMAVFGAVSAGVARLVDLGLPADWFHLVRLAVMSAAAGLVFLGINAWFKPEAFVVTVRIVGQRLAHLRNRVR